MSNFMPDPIDVFKPNRVCNECGHKFRAGLFSKKCPKCGSDKTGFFRNLWDGRVMR